MPIKYSKNSNKILLNVSKTELFLFRPRGRSMDFSLKIKLNGKFFLWTNSVEYLGIRIDNKLNCKGHIGDITKVLLMLEFYKQFIMFYLSHIFIMHVLYVCRTECGQNVCTEWGTECMHNQLSFHNSKENSKIDTF